MAQLREAIQWRTMSGDSMTVDGVTVTPQAQALILRFPNGGFVWNRPVAALVERNGQTERIPIVDVTRVAQLGLFAVTVVLSVVVFAQFIRIRRKKNG